MALPEKTLFNRLIRNLRAAMQSARLGPAPIIGSALALWCKESFPGLPRSGLRSIPRLKRDPAVRALVDFVKTRSLHEATYWLSSAYAQLTSEEHRKRFAMYFTPPSLASRLLDDLQEAGVDFATRRFCDPACGGAAFLIPVAMRIRDALRQKGRAPLAIIHQLEESLIGFDQDRNLCALSKHFLLMVLYREVLTCKRRPHFQIYRGDSLLKTANLLGRFDVVVCNPPFRKMPASEVAIYASRFGGVIDAQPNIYALFFVLCVRLLAAGGTCALVSPTSFLSGQLFSKLRQFLMAHSTVISIGMVSDRFGVFMDVEQETALTLVRREECGHQPTIEADVSLVSRHGDYVDVGRCALPNSGAAWPIPRSESDVTLLRRASKTHATLADYGYIARVGAFVWNRDPRATYASAKSAALARGRTAVPLLWSSDIKSGGKLQFTGAPKPNRERCFVNLGAIDHASVVRNPSVLLQRVTSNEQPKRLVAAAISNRFIKTYGGFVGENHTVILEQVRPNPLLTPKLMAQLLGTPTVDRYFRCISGATNVSIFELNQLRLPEPHRLLRHLAKTGDMASAARKALG